MNIAKITNRQIMNTVDTVLLYRTKIRNDKETLRWELMSTGETPKTERLKKQIAIDEESLGKYLDMEM